MYQADVQPSVNVYADYHLSGRLLHIYEKATVRTAICTCGNSQEMTKAPVSG